MSYSEQLWSRRSSRTNRITLVRKIVNQARRTRDLVANLLSFAQQAPGEKILVDLSVSAQPRHANARGRADLGQNSDVSLSSSRISPTCAATPTSYFRHSSKSSRTPWTRSRKSAAARSKSRAQRDGTRDPPPVLRQRPRHSRSAARLRSLLHHQARRQRHRPRPERRLRRHPGSRRPDHLPEQSRRRRIVHAPAAGDHRGRQPRRWRGKISLSGRTDCPLCNSMSSVVKVLVLDSSTAS